MRKYVFLSVLALCLINSCTNSKKSALTDAELQRIALEQKIELVEASGGLVLMVGGEPVTSDEILNSQTEINMKVVKPIEYFKPIAQNTNLEQFKEQARKQLEEILISNISNLLLYQHAKRQAGEETEEGLEKAADSELRKFVLRFGGDQAKADEALQKMGLDRESFKERQKRFILVQSYISSKLPYDRPITHHELIDSYNEIKDEYFARPAMIQFLLIDIEPAGLKTAGLNTNSREFARELAQKFLARIKKDEDLPALAEEFIGVSFIDQSNGVRPENLGKPYDILVAEAEKMQPGDITEPIETPDQQHIFIMKLIEKQSTSYEPFENVQRQVEEKILLYRQNEVLNRLNDIIMQQAKLGDTDEFIDFCLEKIYRMSNQ